MKNLRAIAVDDESIALDVIVSHSSKVPFLNLEREFTNAFEALEYLQKNNIDLVFLDIKMPDLSGIEFYKSLRKRPLLIFTTAYGEHARQGFDLDAVDYLLKPFSFGRFLKACTKALEFHNFRNSIGKVDYCYIQSGHQYHKVNFEEIFYLEAAGNYVTFALGDQKILSRITFSEAVEILPSNMFLRVHRSFVVSKRKIEKIEKHQLRVGNKIIPVSKAFRKNVLDLLK